MSENASYTLHDLLQKLDQEIRALQASNTKLQAENEALTNKVAATNSERKIFDCDLPGVVQEPLDPAPLIAIGQQSRARDDNQRTDKDAVEPQKLKTHQFLRRATGASESGAGVQTFRSLKTGALNAYPKSLRELVKWSVFEMTIGLLIFCNAVVMAIDAEYKGLSTGYQLDLRDRRPAQDVMPAWEDIHVVFDMLFGIVFTIELLLKILALRVDFIKVNVHWNILDAVAVIGWFLSKLASNFSFDTRVLRLVRLLKLLRLLKMFKTLRVFESLYLILASLAGSFNILAWTLVILLIVHMMVALVMCQFFEAYIENAEYPMEDRMEAHKFFGTFLRSMLTMFELTLGNWVPVSRFLVDRGGKNFPDVSSTFWFVMVLSYKMTMGFAVVKVINGVFIKETFKAAENDDELMIMQKRSAAQNFRQRVTQFFDRLDSSGDGSLTREEFKRGLEKPSMKLLLSGMEIDVGDVDVLFDYFEDDGDGSVEVRELISGISRLRGVAKSIDVISLSLRLARMEHSIEAIAMKLRL